MRVDKKEARQLAKLAALLSNVGVTVDVDKIQKDAAAHVPTESEKLEGVLASIRRPGDFTYRICKRESCRQPFGSNYSAVAYCADLCRIKDFEETTGIKWSTKTQEERWGGEPPLVIPPGVVRKMLQYSKMLVQYAEIQGWDSIDDIPDPVLLEQSTSQSAPQNLNQQDQSNGNGLTISLVQPAQTMQFVIE